jgi:hypothetical protein
VLRQHGVEHFRHDPLAGLGELAEGIELPLDPGRGSALAGKPKRQRFKCYPIGFFRMDIAEVQAAEGKLYLFVGIDRTSNFAVNLLVDKADRRTAWEFREHLLKAVAVNRLQ